MTTALQLYHFKHLDFNFTKAAEYRLGLESLVKRNNPDYFDVIHAF